jgi:hypothetical protein
MNISMKTLGLALAAMSVAPASQAAEGMWMPKQLPAIASALKAEGLAIEPTRLSQLTEFPMAAIVSLGGCSASPCGDQPPLRLRQHPVQLECAA